MCSESQNQGHAIEQFLVEANAEDHQISITCRKGTYEIFITSARVVHFKISFAHLNLPCSWFSGRVTALSVGCCWCEPQLCHTKETHKIGKNLLPFLAFGNKANKFPLLLYLCDDGFHQK